MEQTGFDAFSYVLSLRPNAFDYRQQAFSSPLMDSIRNSGLYQQMLWVSPASQISIAPLSSSLEQLAIRPNTILYGLKATQILDEEELESGDFTIKIWQASQAGVNITRQQFVRQSFANDTYGVGSLTELGWLPLAEPFLITDAPLSVEISNPSLLISIRPQLVLLCAEPLPALNSLAGKYCKL